MITSKKRLEKSLNHTRNNMSLEENLALISKEQKRKGKGSKDNNEEASS